MVKSSSTANNDYKNENHSENVKSEKEYNLEKIHDLGFTLASKPFNLVLIKRRKTLVKVKIQQKLIMKFIFFANKILIHEVVNIR